jgi:hypothetical protein
MPFSPDSHKPCLQIGHSNRPTVMLMVYECFIQNLRELCNTAVAELVKCDKKHATALFSATSEMKKGQRGKPFNRCVNFCFKYTGL